MKINVTKVVGSRIKIDVTPAEAQTTAGGIIIETDIKGMEEQEIGVVAQLGHLAYANFEDTGPWCKVGDKVFFQRYGGKPKEEIGEDGKVHYYRIIKDIDVIALVDSVETQK